MSSEWLNYDGPAGKPVYIRWFMSSWCNYNCNYCFWTAHPRKGRFHKLKHALRRPALLPTVIRPKRNRPHAFDNFDVSEWTRAFEQFAPRPLAMTISGGEPFLDAKRFAPLLTELTRMEHVKTIRIDTNLSWSVAKFNDVDWQKVSINASYHPSQTSLDQFEAAVKEKLDAGVRVTMVNFVLAPDQVDAFIRLKDAMDGLGVFVNANVFVEVHGIEKDPRADDLYGIYVPEIDVEMKTGDCVPEGRPCMYPRFSYELAPTGVLNVGCFPAMTGHLIDGRLPHRFDEAVPCPFPKCACIDMYAFRVEIPERGNNLDLLEEYVGQVKTYREGKG